jgi:hypothetical protein
MVWQRYCSHTLSNTLVSAASGWAGRSSAVGASTTISGKALQGVTEIHVLWMHVLWMRQHAALREVVCVMHNSQGRAMAATQCMQCCSAGSCTQTQHAYQPFGCWPGCGGVKTARAPHQGMWLPHNATQGGSGRPSPEPEWWWLEVCWSAWCVVLVL